MPSDAEWAQRIRDLLNERIGRRDVTLALRVEADPELPFDVLDDDEFAGWVEGWIDLTVTTTAGPLSAGVAEEEWLAGVDKKLRIQLLMTKGGDSEGRLVR